MWTLRLLPVGLSSGFFRFSPQVPNMQTYCEWFRVFMSFPVSSSSAAAGLTVHGVQGAFRLQQPPAEEHKHKSRSRDFFYKRHESHGKVFLVKISET